MKLLLSTQPFLLTLAIPARRNPHATAMAPSSKAAVAFHPSKAAQQMNPLPRILIESLNNPIHVANGSRGAVQLRLPRAIRRYRAGRQCPRPDRPIRKPSGVLRGRGAGLPARAPSRWCLRRG
ncbi:hypothetical protein PG993_008232 [Apiospora rasikravindrae]|uniref:Uncharacterized protein n=1 Tax=Apiospora rasikravindrae TaxID=990691 RepID=A0ABR1SZR9_9PEZI